MKIEGPNKTTATKGVSKAGAKKDGDGAFGALISDTEEMEAQAPVARATPVGALDVLLMLQGADGSTSEEAAKKSRKRAVDLLEHLDKIRHGLLTGELPKSAVQQLSDTISSHREMVLDPRLSEILDEIDLRAQVELAKLG
jgi:hypothetical protein